MNYKVAIAGCGGISSVHVDALKNLPNVQIVAVSDPDASKTGQYPYKSYDNYEAMLDEHDGIDVLHICLPHFLHAPAAIYAMERKIHVLSEKPMAISVPEAESMIKTAADNNVTLGVIFQNRYNPGSQLIKKALVSGKLGKIKSGWLRVTWYRDEKYYTDSTWRGKWSTEGGGALINQSIHTFDLINYFMSGQYENLQVDASIANRAHPSIEVEDVVEGVLSYDDVKISFYANTINPYDAPVEIEIICENGRAAIKGDSGFIEYADGKTETSDGLLADEDELNVPLKAYWGLSHVRQIKAFYDALKEGVTPEIDGREALKIQRLVCAIYEAGTFRQALRGFESF